MGSALGVGSLVDFKEVKDRLGLVTTIKSKLNIPSMEVEWTRKASPKLEADFVANREGLVKSAIWGVICEAVVDFSLFDHLPFLFPFFLHPSKTQVDVWFELGDQNRFKFGVKSAEVRC